MVGRFAEGQEYNNACLTTCGQGTRWQAVPSSTEDQILTPVCNSTENDKHVTGNWTNGYVNNATLVINNFTQTNVHISGINN